MAGPVKVETMKGGIIRSQMTKYGWLEGKGLGKNEQGKKDPIKVSLKNNKNGLGLDPSEQFVFHWWDHVFNKVASNIKIEEDEQEVKISKRNDTQLEGKISHTRPSNATKGKQLLYGRFVRSNTSVVGNDLVKNDGEEASSSSESEEDDIKDFSRGDTLEKAFMMSGGRTAHKAARHGHKLNGKLKRLQEQENGLASLNIQSTGSYQDEIKKLQVLDTETKKDDFEGKQNKKAKKKKKHRDLNEENGSCCLKTEVSSQDQCDYEMKKFLKKKEKQKKKKANDRSCSDLDSFNLCNDYEKKRGKRTAKRKRDFCKLVDSYSVNDVQETANEEISKRSKKKKRFSPNCELDTEDRGMTSKIDEKKEKAKKKKKIKNEKCREG